MEPSEVTKAFVDRINAHDVDGLCALMTPNHVFVDGGGDSVTGRDAMRRAWQAYFNLIPDYYIHVDHVMNAGNIVAILGRAGGTCAVAGRLDPGYRWEVPAAWQAVVAGELLCRWQVYADTQSLRAMIQKAGDEAAPI